tara:strand:+ start:928 stop:1077 length:150 start_codon:yes stop_codon:yes gene_type:complete
VETISKENSMGSLAQLGTGLHPGAKEALVGAEQTDWGCPKGHLVQYDAN